MCAVGLAALTALGLMSAPAQASQPDRPSAPRASTAYGVVQGHSHDGVDSFLGVPYAAPPVGALRWQPPRAPRPWTGVRAATAYGPRCAALASTNGARSISEDCLYLNVQRPTGLSRSARVPVYVFVHGGGLVNGSSNQASGNKIVRLTNAIVVSMNYRLGVFGFLGLPGMPGSGTGDFGFMDQQAALRWVRQNIAAFGGDPSRVTLGGESAGAFSVCSHLTAPGSRGLFARAMMQSGSCESRPLADTQADSARFASAAGCTGGDQLACLRRLGTLKLLRASKGFSPTLTSGTPVLPRPPATDVEQGRFARVPIVNGSNRDEGRTFSAGDIGETESDYDAFVRSTFGDDAAKVLARYPWPDHATKFTAAYLIGAITTDDGLAAGIGGCPELRLTQTFAKYTRTYSYEFSHRTGPGIRPIKGYVWGAGHAAELAYLFPSFDNGTPIAPTFDAAERQLSLDMIHYWTSFVFHGNPSVIGQAQWSAYSSSHELLALRAGGASGTLSTSAYRTEHQCAFWESIGR